MGRQRTGKISVCQRIEIRPNGDRYVYERHVAYDPETKKTKTIKTKLLGKIPSGSEEMIPTRPKKKTKPAIEKECQSEESCVEKTVKTRVGATQILEWIGRESGIDEDLAHSFVGGEPDKIRSIARYWLATDGQTLPRLETWQLTHQLPYSFGISEDVYHKLFSDIGINESGIQNYFRCRADRLNCNNLIAYDSTTVSTHSMNQIEARQGFNKDHDGLDTIKLLTLYSVTNQEPIAFAKQPGNIPDVVALDNALTQLDCFSLSKPMIVTDNGYYSEANLLEYVRRNKKFLTLCRPSVVWIRKCIDEAKIKMNGLGAVCPFDPNITGATITVMHRFNMTRQRTRGAYKAGDCESIVKRLYVHVYYNITGAGADEVKFRAHLLELQKQLLDGQTEFKLSAQEEIAQYFTLSTVGRGGKLRVSPNDENIREARNYCGYFVLISNEKMDTFEALLAYRMREKIEELFAVQKESMDGRRPRVWYSDNLRGRQFVQFVGLGYYCFMRKKLLNLKESLGKDKTLSKKELAEEENLLKWLDGHSMIQIFDWFDCVERTDVGDRHWTTETTLRDQLFLKKLGVTK